MYKQYVNEYTIDKLKTELNKQSWADVMQCRDLNSVYGKFYLTLQKCYKRSIPVKKKYYKRQPQAMADKLFINIH